MTPQIDPQSPAEAAELLEGDINVSFTGERASAMEELHRRLLTADRIGKYITAFS
jgi:S1-C subfamily serine protease